MITKLKSFKFSGIKNIKEPFEINFIKNKTVKNEDLDTNHISAIYGPNGVGKSAFVQALTIYRSLVLEENSVIKHDEYIKEYFNKNSNEIILEATFLVTKEKVQNAMEIRHKIVIDKDLNLVEEMIESKSRKIKILEGKFSEETNVINSDNMQLMNLLDKSTITTLFMSKEIKLGKYRDMIMFLIIAVIKLEIISEIKDDNFAKIKLEQNKKNGNKEELYKKINDQNLNPNNNITDVTIVDEGNIKKFSDEWKKIEKFIKLIKPQIQGIMIETKRIEEDNFKCTVFVEYENEKINILNESVGILKMINLYHSIQKLVNDSTTLVIDELDAHLHDVLLNQLLNFVCDNECGQLIFTIHNLSVMDKLKEKNNSIIMFDLEQNIHYWERKGNKSPVKAYQYGYITDDFKYGIFDFDEVFMND